MTCWIYDARGNGGGAICPTLTGDHQNRVTDYTAIVLVNDEQRKDIWEKQLWKIPTDRRI